MLLRKFFENKPIIAVVHLPPLPGSPNYEGSFDSILERALSDAKKYVEEGVDALIIENFGDKPFSIRVKEPETIAAISIVAYVFKKEFKVPIGINILRNSGVEALAIAHVVKANFIRVNSLCQLLSAPEGLIVPVARELAMKRRNLKAENVWVFADVNVKHAVPIGHVNLELIVKDCEERGFADAIIITGSRTGEEARVEEILRAKRATSKPVIVGSGITIENIEKYWNHADGFIIGTYFKKNGITENPVSVERVRKFMNYVRRLREKTL